MGEKGAKHTSEADLGEKLLMEKLSTLNGVTTKKMFGGFGIFHEGKMFGLVDRRGDIYFKVNDESKQQYIDEGAVQHSRMPYYSITPEVLNDIDLMMARAQHSIEISK